MLLGQEDRKKKRSQTVRGAAGKKGSQRNYGNLEKKEGVGLSRYSAGEKVDKVKLDIKMELESEEPR